MWCSCIDYLWNLCLGLTQVYVLSFMFLMRCSLQSFFPAMTKIVGTLGPKSRSVEIISGCLKAGMSGISGPVAFIIPYLFYFALSMVDSWDLREHIIRYMSLYVIVFVGFERYGITCLTELTKFSCSADWRFVFTWSQILRNTY